MKAISFIVGLSLLSSFVGCLFILVLNMDNSKPLTEMAGFSLFATVLVISCFAFNILRVVEKSIKKVALHPMDVFGVLLWMFIAGFWLGVYVTK